MRTHQSATLGSRELGCPWRLVFAMVTVVLLVLGCDDSPAAETLTIGLARTAAETDQTDAATFEALVEGLSAGAIDVEIYGGVNSCGDSAACLRALQAGSIDVVPTTTGDFVHLFPELQVLDLPYLFESEAVVELVFEGPFYARMRDAVVDRTGLQLMALSTTGGWHTLATSGRAVRAPDDIEGLTLWTARSPVEAGLVAAFGGSSTGLPLSQLSTALTAGVIHGATLPLTDLVAMGLHEQIRYVTFDRHNHTKTLWLMNDTAYRALSPNLQQLVHAGFDELTRLRRGMPGERLAHALRLFEASGGEVYTPTADQWREFLMAAGHVRAEYVETYGADWLVWLEGAIAEAEAAIGSSGGREPHDR